MHHNRGEEHKVLIETQTFTDPTAFVQSGIDLILKRMKERHEKGMSFRIGLAGGSTPRELYRTLADQKIDWSQVELISIDERQVPSDHEKSNQKMIRETLIDHIKINPENTYFFDTNMEAEESAKDMSKRLIQLTTTRFPLIDLLILGVGTDGHIASLFNGDKATQSTHYSDPATAEGYDIEERLTLTLMALRQSTEALILLHGDTKQEIFERLQDMEKQRCIEGAEPKPAPECDVLDELLEEVPAKVFYLN